MDEPIWQLDHVCLAGDGQDRVHDATVAISQGVTAVMGPSGAGKTSLLNLLVGFEKPGAGQVQFNRAILPDGLLAIFWSPQDGGLWPHLTARQHLEWVAPLDRRQASQKATVMLEAFDITDRAEARPDHLSLGQRARLSVARALMTHARVLVLDEPLAHVDLGQAETYWEIIRHHIDSTAMSLVFSSHAPSAVLAEAQDVVCLDMGRVIYQGDVASLYWRPANQKLAQCLGKVNWLTAQEAVLWFDGTGTIDDHGCCYRPNQISITPRDESPIIVRNRRFHGNVCEVELEHQVAAKMRRFVHHPSSCLLETGMRVAIRTCLLLLCLLATACNGSADPPLQFSKVNYWSIPPDGPMLPAPRSIAMGQNTEVFVLDTAGRILVFIGDGQIHRQWRMPDVEKGKPEGVCFLADGRLAVADTHYHRVVFFDQGGRMLGMFGEYGEGPGQFIYPVKLTQDNKQNLYVAEYGGNDRIQKFSPDGDLLLSFGGFSTDPGHFQRPGGIVWHDGQIYVADAINNRIQIFTDNGQFIKILESDHHPWALKYPYDLALGPNGLLYVIEWGTGCLTAIETTGRLIGRFPNIRRGQRKFRTPWAVAVDQNNRVLVADTGNRRIAELVQ